MLAVVLVILKFQSTLPHGSDRGEASSRCRAVHFNPRSLAGATCFAREAICITINFNPRSLAGATDTICFSIIFLSNFNPRSLAGATRGSLPNSARTLISIHAPLRERPAPIPGRRLMLTFQSTLPCGSDGNGRPIIVMD